MGSIMNIKSAIINAKEKLSSQREYVSDPNTDEFISESENDLREIKESDLFKHTNRVSIELSNLCNYSMIHKKCPINRIKKPVILPSKVVYSVFNTLKKYDFHGNARDVRSRACYCDRDRWARYEGGEADSVTKAASDRGVGPMGRFFADYRDLMGEKPSETLGRTRARCGR